jgi:hypothetical protein
MHTSMMMGIFSPIDPPSSMGEFPVRSMSIATAPRVDQ